MNYGMGIALLARKIRKPKAVAEEIMKLYMQRYPAVQQFYKEAVDDVLMTSPLFASYTLLGRRRCLPGIDSLYRKERGRAERQATNLPIQGSAADVAKMAMIHVEEDGVLQRLGYQQQLQVHDELFGPCPVGAEKEVMDRLRNIMMHPFEMDLAVDLEVSLGFGLTWDTAK